MTWRTWTPLILLAMAIIAGACGGDDLPSGLPLGFPRNFPIYGGAQVSNSGAVGNAISVEFLTDDPRQKVADFYRNALTREPWVLVSARDDLESDASFAVFKTNDREINGTMTIQAGEQTKFIVTLGFKSLPTATPPPEASPTPSPTGSPEATATPTPEETPGAGGGG